MAEHDVCPACRGPSARTLDSRPHACGGRRRRRICDTCSHRWTTIEVAEAEVEALRNAARSLDLAARSLDDARRVMARYERPADPILAKESSQCTMALPQLRGG